MKRVHYHEYGVFELLEEGKWRRIVPALSWNSLTQAQQIKQYLAEAFPSRHFFVDRLRRM